MDRSNQPSDDVLQAKPVGKSPSTGVTQQRSETPTSGLSGTAESNPGVAVPQKLPAEAVPAEFQSLTGYTDIRELGKGGMGVVYLAKNKLLDREEVLKVVGRQLLEKPGAKERFLQEIRAAAKLQHPNVVGAYSAYEVGESLVFAMEYVPGEDLAHLVKTKGPLPVGRACSYIAQAAQGLQHAYERKMVHRDIKPGNLILTRENNKAIVKILDFGLAKATSEKALDSALTGDGKMLGTPDYISPEQSLDAAKADIHADIYSLGCSLHFLLTGAPPFRAGSLYELLKKHHSEMPPALNTLRPDVSEELAAIAHKMMAKKPGDRYAAPRDVVAALVPFTKAAPAAKPNPSGSGTTNTATRPAVILATPVPQAGRADPFGSFTDSKNPTAKVERKPAPNMGDDVFDDEETVPAAASRPWLVPLIGVCALFVVLIGGGAALYFAGVFNKDNKTEVAAKPTNPPAPAPAVKAVEKPIPKAFEPAPKGLDPSTRAAKMREAARERALTQFELDKTDVLSVNPATRSGALRNIAGLLSFDDVEVRRKAAQWFATATVDTSAAIASVRRASTSDPDAEVKQLTGKVVEAYDQRAAAEAQKMRAEALAGVDASLKDAQSTDPVIQEKGLRGLAAALNQSDIGVRRKAAGALATLDTDTAGILPAIRDAAKDSDLEVRQYAQAALKIQEKYVAIRMAKAKEAEVLAVKASAEDAGSADAATRRKGITGLVAGMRNSDPMIRRMAMAGLCSVTVEDNDVAGAIRSGTRDSDAEVSKMAKAASEVIEKRAAAAFEPLLKKLKSTKAADQIAALNEIAALGEKAQPLSPAVGRAMLSPTAAVKEAALNCFEKIDPQCHRHLITALFDESLQKRNAATEKLGNMGADAAGAVDPLKYAYQKSVAVKSPFGQSNPNYQALVALVKIVPADSVVVSEILLLVGKPYDGNRFRFNDERAVGLGCIDLIEVKPETKLKALMAALDDPTHRLAVVKRIAAMGRDAKPALRALEALKTDANADVRAAAAQAVETIKGE